MTTEQRNKLMEAAKKVAELNTIAALGIREAYMEGDAENIVKQVNDQIEAGAIASMAKATSWDLVDIVQEITGREF